MVEAVALSSNDCSAAGLSKTALQVFSTGLNVPRLKPTFLVESGPTAVSVAVIGPPVSVMNACVSPLAGFTVPVKVSLTTVGVGIVGILSAQPAVSASTPHKRDPHAIRRNISSPHPDDRLLDLKWPESV